MTTSAAQSQIAMIAEPAEVRSGRHVLPPEFLLLVACCRWPLSQERVAAIRHAAKHVRHWDELLSILKRHRLIGFVTEAFHSAGIVLPKSAADELLTRMRRYTHRRLNLIAETARLPSLLAAAGIPVVVLKGAALEQLAFKRLLAKQTRDIDLLVPPECAEAALRLIEGAGYGLSLPAKKLNSAQRRALIRYSREIELVNLDKKLRVELQWRAADNPLLLKGIDAHAETQPVPLSDSVTIRTLAPDDLFAYLCVHGARHSWSRLKWLADLNALVISSGADIERLYRHAQKIGAGYCAGQALLLCQQLLGLKLSAGIAAELQNNKRCQRLVAIAMAALTAPHTTTEVDPGIKGVARELRYRFLLGQGLRFYFTECCLALVGSADIVRLPLPRPLHFIYPLVRVPMWLWRRFRTAWSPPRSPQSWIAWPHVRRQRERWTSRR